MIRVFYGDESETYNNLGEPKTNSKGDLQFYVPGAGTPVTLITICDYTHWEYTQ